MACGDWHTVALVEGGVCYAVGYNKAGCLGLGHNSNVKSFTRIPGLQSVVLIAAGQNISMFVDGGGRIYSAGSALLHGNASKENQLVPTPIEAFGDRQIKTMSCGYVHCAAVDGEGCLYTWGSSSHYQLGHNSDVQSACPL